MQKIIILQKHPFISLHMWMIMIFTLILTILLFITDDAINKFACYVFLLFSYSFIYTDLWKKFLFLKKGYVSSLYFSENKLQIVYSYILRKKAKILNLNEIKDFNILIKTGIRLGSYPTPSCYQRFLMLHFIINTEFSKLEFDAYPYMVDGIGGCIYQLLDILGKKPFFNYKVEGDDLLEKTMRDYIN